MAQSGFTPVQLYRSATAAATPTAGNLADGELAINTADGKLFYKDSGGVVQTLATASGATGDVVGPASSTNDGLVAFNGTTGKLIKAAGTVTVAQGGTGATDAGTARTNLGLGTISTQSAASVAITGGSITGITDLAVADGGTGASSASVARSNLGAAASGAVTGSGLTQSADRILGRTTAGTGAIEEITIGSGLSFSAGTLTATGSGGSVTSVGVSGGTTGLTTSGGPITTSGTITLAGTLNVANGGTGSATASGALTNLGAVAKSGDTMTGALAVVAGTVSAPGLAASGDSNTGIFFPAADTIAFAEGGVEAMRLDSTGRLGLGTTSPAARFDLAGDYKEGFVTANTGTAYTIDLTSGTVQNLTLTGNCTFTFPAATTTGRSFLLLLRQDATGGRTATWPATVRWPGGTAPTLTSTASRTDKFVFTSDGTNWLASNAGQNYSA